MRYQELINENVVRILAPKTIGWINIKTKEFFGWDSQDFYGDGESHVEFAVNHSDFFELPTFKVMTSGDYDGNKEILAQMYKRNWIRIIHKAYEDSETNIQGANRNQILQAARIIDKIDKIEFLYFDINNRPAGNLRGRELRLFLRTGKINKKLNEEVEIVEGIKVLVNPTIATLRKFIIKETQYEEVKVLFDGKDFYFWDGGSIIHDHMARKLGIDEYTRLNIKFNRMSNEFLIDLLNYNRDLNQHSYYKKLKGLNKSSINEKVEMVDGVKILVNPTVSVLYTFIKRSFYRSARALFDGKDFYFWDASSLTHDHVAPMLGLGSISTYMRLQVSLRARRFKINDVDLQDRGLKMLEHPYYKKLIEYRSTINEKVEMVYGVKVLVNPRVEVLRKFILGSTHGTVRGLFDGKDFYFWIEDYIHDQMAPKLGLDLYTRLDLWRNKDQGTFNIEPLDDMVPVEENPYYLKLRREG